MEKSRKVTKGEALYMLLLHVRSIHKVAQTQLRAKERDTALDGYGSMILGDCVAAKHWAKHLGIVPKRRK